MAKNFLDDTSGETNAGKDDTSDKTNGNDDTSDANNGKDDTSDETNGKEVSAQPVGCGQHMESSCKNDEDCKWSSNMCVSNGNNFSILNVELR